MRLAVFTNQFPSRPSTFFARDMRALIEAGVSVDVFPIYPLDRTLWDEVPELLSERFLPHDRVHHVAPAWGLRPPRRGGWAGIPRALRAVAALERAALRFGPMPAIKSAYVALKAWAWAQRFPAGSFDHVLAYWGNYSASAAYLYQLLTDPSTPFSMLVHARMDLYQDPVYLAEKMLYADNVFLVCEFNRGYIRARFSEVFPRLEDKIRIHHLGLDLAGMPFSAQGRSCTTVVAVGRFERLKGLHCLLDAVAMLGRQGCRIEVDLVGGGEEEGSLRTQAATLGIGAQVRFRGWMREGATLDAIRQAMLLVHPSIRPDAMPTVIKEAIALGTPVIASDLAGIPEILDQGRCGVLVPPGDVSAIAEAIQRLVQDGTLRGRYALAGRAHAERCFDMWANGRVLAEQLRTTTARGRSLSRVSP